MDQNLILFDLDGTLANSISLLKTVYEKFLSLFDIQGTSLEFEELNGPTIDGIVAVLRKRYQLTDSLSSLGNKYRRILDEHYADALPNPGAIDMVKFANDSGWTCGVVTANSEIIAREWLTENNFMPYILDIIGLESVHDSKPHPEPYLLALAKFNREAHKAFAVEDSINGVLSASRAGIKTLAYIPNQNSEKYLASGCYATIHSLFELENWLKVDNAEVPKN